MKTLHIIRGLPGSGKSTLAKNLGLAFTALGQTIALREADSFFTNEAGQYLFDPKRIGEAHMWCRDRVEEAMLQDVDNVVVSNTFVQKWEVSHYIQLAKKWGYVPILYSVNNNHFGSIHGVPMETIQRMKARWQNFTLDDFYG